MSKKLPKANEKIPRDEMDLAKAIAAAKAYKLRGTTGMYFTNRRRDWLHLEEINKATSCCAYGALCLAGLADIDKLSPTRFYNVVDGNDCDSKWFDDPNDRGESLGWAFRKAVGR